MQDTKLIVRFKEEFGNKLWSQDKDFVINDEDLRISFRILNECIFESKLDNNVKFTIEEFRGQKSKGSFRAGYIADKQKYKQDIRFTRQPGEDNFFRIICVLAHEMIHMFDFNFGKWSSFENRLLLKTDFQLKTQTIGEYDIHGEFFETIMKKVNSYGFNIQKLYSRKDDQAMKTIDEDTEQVKEDIDEIPAEERNLLDATYAKVMYDNIKTDDYKNFFSDENGNWMIEVQ